MRLIIPIGPAGCGKTRYYNKDFSHFIRISADEIRSKILNSKKTGVYWNAEIESKVWNKVWSKYLNNMSSGTNIYLDATNLTIRTRFPFINIAKFFNYKIELIFFKTSLIKILQRNEQRERRVDEKVICRQFLKLERPEKYEYDRVIHQY